MKMNDDYLPACPKCGGHNFTAVLNQRVGNAEDAIAMIICSKEGCETVVGVIPKKEVWKDL